MTDCYHSQRHTYREIYIYMYIRTRAVGTRDTPFVIGIDERVSRRTAIGSLAILGLSTNHPELTFVAARPHIVPVHAITSIVQFSNGRSAVLCTACGLEEEGYSMLISLSANYFSAIKNRKIDSYCITATHTHAHDDNKS